MPIRTVLLLIATAFAIGVGMMSTHDTTPVASVGTYSSSAHDYAVALPAISVPLNADTVPDAAPVADDAESTPKRSTGSSNSTDRSEDIVDADRAPIGGDDNGDGVIDEDESGWNCETMGNGRCGTGTVTAEDGSEVPASFYDN